MTKKYQIQVQEDIQNIDHESEENHVISKVDKKERKRMLKEEKKLKNLQDQINGLAKEKSLTRKEKYLKKKEERNKLQANLENNKSKQSIDDEIEEVHETLKQQYMNLGKNVKKTKKKLKQQTRNHLKKKLQQQSQIFQFRKKVKKQKIAEDSQEQNQKNKIDSLSIVIPDSIIQIAQSAELRSYFISEIARTASIFKVDEIIVLKDHSYKTKSPNFDSLGYVCRNLQYLETPQYLRKYLFPIHPDLKYTGKCKQIGLMNPIEARHHLKFEEYFPYREGVVCNRPVKPDQGSWADIGLKKQCQLDYHLQPNTRITVHLNQDSLNTPLKNFTGQVVPQNTPMLKMQTYWGYSVRIAQHLAEVDRGYDTRICIGKRGQKVDIDVLQRRLKGKVLVVFGGHEGVEQVVEGDEKSRIREQNLSQEFDFYFCLNDDSYGVKSLRVEEEMQMFLQMIQQVYTR